jgi:pantoate--beta-alanine ligase
MKIHQQAHFTMVVVEKIADLRQLVASHRQSGKRIGFVPTMGALHAGHLSLIDTARKHSDIVVASVFVNPIQFNDPKDFAAYPITTEADKALLRGQGCDIVFMPSKEEMYPDAPTEHYDFGQMERVMEGACRPGHFNGVAVIVKRLFDMVQPDKAFFGQKDFQQLAIIKALVAKLQLPVEIISCATVREIDGLAMSSRNMRLSQAERTSALRISQALRKAVAGDFSADPVLIQEKALSFLSEDSNLRPEYFEIVDADTLMPVAGTLRNAVACTAVFDGPVRLIDNMYF